MCDCPPGTMPQEYTNVVACPLPQHCIDDVIRRQGFIRHRTVHIDRCIVPEIEDLWSRGIVTTASCCGHNMAPGNILVRDEDIDRMRELGYRHWPNGTDPSRQDGFFAKSV